jgi:FkbM family methyltransferase
MFTDSLAGIFRSLNANLLYVRFQPLEKLLKIPFFLSVKIFKSWIKKAHNPRWVNLTIDRTIKMKVDSSKIMGAAFYWMGFHELNEWRFLNHYLKPDMVLADIGANQGEFVLFSAKRLTRGMVLAFEPVDFLSEQLKVNIALNPFTNIRTFAFGLSDAPARIPIYMGATGAGEHEGLATIFQSDQRNRFIQEIELKVFDEEVGAMGINRLDFLKIDVEGAELVVLKGSRKTIEKYRPAIMLEISEDTYRNAGYSVEDVKSFFHSLGYSLHLIVKGGKLVPASTTPAFCNVVFLPNR